MLSGVTKSFIKTIQVSSNSNLKIFIIATSKIVLAPTVILVLFFPTSICYAAHNVLGETFEYNRSLRNRRPNADQALRVGKDQIKRTIHNPTSIEDFLYTPPTPTQPFPGVSKLPGIYANLSKSRLTSKYRVVLYTAYMLSCGWGCC